MTSVPYPSFANQLPVADGRLALSAVGKCRLSCCKMESIVEKCVAQAKETDTKIRKKFMKQGVAMAKEMLLETLQLDVSIVDVEMVVAADDLVATDGCLAACWLDAGCHRVVTDGTCLEAMDVAKIPRDRLVAHFDDRRKPPSLQQVICAAELASIVSIEFCGEEKATIEGVVELLQTASDEHSRLDFQVVVQLSQENIAGASDDDLAALVAGALKHCKDGHGTVSLVDPSARQLGLSFTACMTTDRPDGLYTTVVCTRAGEALGLVYSSRESVVAALECGRGVYYSRSRKGLWRKGDTSGHYQTLHRLDLDCDGDALRATVTQRGNDVAAFCHLDTLTCWGEPTGIRHLEGTLRKRLEAAPEGSYTKRLFNDDQLLRDKLVEEAQELSEAQEPQHVAEELADVLYFAMTRAVKAGVSIDDAVAELDRRTRKVTRRKGDSKAFRIEAGQEILSKNDKDGA